MTSFSSLLKQGLAAGLLGLAMGVHPAVSAGMPGSASGEAAPAAVRDEAPRKFAPAAASDKAVAARAFMEAVPVDGDAASGLLEGLKPSEAAPSEFDPVANPRVHEISSQLRCLVCANETIAESNAQLAVDLRREVAAQVKAGRSDDEIVAFMVERYGDFVLFRPPFKAKTWLLWTGPFVFILLVAWGMRRVIVVRRAEAALCRRRATPEALGRARDFLEGRTEPEDLLHAGAAPAGMEAAK